MGTPFPLFWHYRPYLKKRNTKQELELYGKSGREFENRKREEIDRILQENPYHDLDMA